MFDYVIKNVIVVKMWMKKERYNVKIKIICKECSRRCTKISQAENEIRTKRFNEKAKAEIKSSLEKRVIKLYVGL